MNSTTGEIKNSEQLKKLFGGKPMESDKWFEIDQKPDPNCRACDGHGFIGYFPNAKVIPCACVFAGHISWASAVVKQRDLGKASQDKGAAALRS